VDTAVLVFAVGADHPHVEPRRRLLQAVAAGDVHATTTYEVIQEFAHVRARRRGRSEAGRLARSFAQLLAPLLVIGDGDLDLGLRSTPASAASSRRGAGASRGPCRRGRPARSP